MMPGALTSTRRRSLGLDRPLAVDGIAERVDHAAEQALADRHVHDGARALDGLALLDLAVVAEDHDADIVGLEIERHAAHAVLELDHLAGLHVVEAVDAGDAVADRQHLADFGDLGLLAEVLDLLLEDRRNLGRADVHQPASFIASLIALSLVRSEVSTMRLPSLTTSPPMIAGRPSPSPARLLGHGRERVLDGGKLRVARPFASVTSAVLALVLGDQRAICLIMSSAANSRRLVATSLRKLAASTSMPALSSTGRERSPDPRRRAPGCAGGARDRRLG